MNKLLSITVKGKRATYSFRFKGDPRYLDEWRKDGLDIDEIVNTIPLWAQQLGLTRPWCRVQDAWNFLRLW